MSINLEQYKINFYNANPEIACKVREIYDMTDRVLIILDVDAVDNFVCCHYNGEIIWSFENPNKKPARSFNPKYRILTTEDGTAYNIDLTGRIIDAARKGTLMRKNVLSSTFRKKSGSITVTA
ncbi:MAG: hypothetical protein OEY94_10560 [Alphaproteobacteria bacterium]|nr:hypothetical protein [Alphaproteobacteria bacterium]